jgi:hypothetical protein
VVWVTYSEYEPASGTGSWPMLWRVSCGILAVASGLGVNAGSFGDTLLHTPYG